MATKPNIHAAAILRAIQDFRDAELVLHINKHNTAPIPVNVQDKYTIQIPAFHFLTAIKAARYDAIARLDNLGVDTTPLDVSKDNS